MTVLFSKSNPKIPKQGIGFKFENFYFSPDFAIREIWGHRFQFSQYYFQIPVTRLIIFDFARIFAFEIFVIVSNVATVKCHPKNTQLRQFWS